jgi:hypothetical protein
LQTGATHFVEVIDKQISEIKINSVPKNPQKTCVKILKQIFACKNTKTNIRLNIANHLVRLKISGFFIVHVR